MNKLPFGKKNYQWMVIGLVVVAIGFTIMALGKDKFGWVAITLGPLVVVAGFITEIFAILHTPNDKP